MILCTQVVELEYEGKDSSLAFLHICARILDFFSLPSLLIVRIS